MTRSMNSLLLGSVLFAGCANPELEARVAKLESQVAELEKRPVGKAPPTPANPEEEAKADELLRAATASADAMNYDDAKAKLAELGTKYPNTRSGRQSKRLAEELAIVGKDAGALETEKWYVGKTDMNAGKATLVVFWEVWCPHCKREVPRLQEVHTKYGPQGLNMVGLTKISKGATEEQVTAFIAEQKLTYPMAKEAAPAGGPGVSERFGVRGIPAAAVVKDGKIVWRGHPAKLTDEMIAKFIS